MYEHDIIYIKDYILTGHAFHRVKARWLIPKDEDVYPAIKETIEKGVLTGDRIKWGFRILCLRKNTITTALLGSSNKRRKQLKALRRRR